MEAFDPFGAALLAHLSGRPGVELTIVRDDGFSSPVPAAHFFREEEAFTRIEREALGLCRGRVLDCGAGTGLHSLVLARRGLPVTSIDVCPAAVEVMRRRGVPEPLVADVSTFSRGPFDTLLMLGHGIGMVATLAGLDAFLDRAVSLLAPGGRLLLDSLDVTRSADPVHLAYQEANRASGRYAGEIRMSLAFDGVTGPPCGWLQVDAATLAARAARAGWRCETVVEEPWGDLLACLGRDGGVDA